MATVAIVDHDPTWPDQFQRLAAELRHHLGEAAGRIDHIGSTAVRGLAAQDVIDLQVTVAGRPPPAAVGPGGPDDQWQATGPPRSSTSPSSDTNRHS